jgi:hypothetical protein
MNNKKKMKDCKYIYKEELVYIYLSTTVCKSIQSAALYATELHGYRFFF